VAYKMEDESSVPLLTPELFEWYCDIWWDWDISIGWRI